MRRLLLSSAVLLGVAVAPYPQSPAHASCAAPVLQVSGSDGVPVLLRRGERVTVTGQGFVDGCDDTGGGSVLGCSGHDSRGTTAPLTDVELVLVQGQPVTTQTSLATSDAGDASGGELGHIAWSFTVSAQQPLGPAVLKTEGSEPLRVRVQR